MSLKDMTLQGGTPDITVANGDPIAFAPDGVTVTNGLHLVCTSDEDFSTRRSLTIKNRPATYDAKTGRYGKDKKTMTLVHPYVLADGSTVFCTFRIEREVHPLRGASVVADMNLLVAQLLIDADTAGFWSTGSLA